MPAETPTVPTVKFGVFEVDLRAGELRKQGKCVRLQQQPFQVLAALLQRPGEVVTREELRSAVWPEDTFVDFDNSLNTAVNKIREALGDSAESPRFVETLPRRGYRFLIPVQGEHTRPTAALSRRKVVLALIVIAVAIAAVFGIWWQARHRPVLSQKDTIVLGEFTNYTGDAVFDGTLREGLSVQLEQSPFLSVISDEGIHQTLRMMGQPANARLTPEVAREICQRIGSAAALNGSIAHIGTRYELILKVIDCAGGNVLASAETRADDKNHILDALDRAASEMRGKLGESLSSLQKYNTPLEQATTPSLEALQAYSLGFRSSWVDSDQSAAVVFLQRAIRLDPNFAMAYRAASNAYTVLGESTLSAENIRKAFALRDRVTEIERLLIESEYPYFVTGDVIIARHMAELGIHTYPREPVFHFNRAIASNFLGEYATGLEEYRNACRMAPYNSFYCRGVIYTSVLSDRLDEAAAAARDARVKGLDSHLAHVLYLIAFYRGDHVEMARQSANASGKPGEEDLLLALEADTAAYFGHLQKARELSRQAENSAEQAGEKENAAIYSAVSALREALFGNASRSLRQSVIAEGRSAGRDLHYACALALAYAGNGRRTQALSDGLAKSFPEDTIARLNYVPTLLAKLSLLRGDPEHALNNLQLAAPYELGLPALSFYNWPNLYPVYVRGEAYLEARRGKEAAAEFQKILDHRGIVLTEPIGALAHLQLGRAYAVQGDTTKAHAAYQDFLTLWKDADPDIPILKKAKAESAALIAR